MEPYVTIKAAHEHGADSLMYLQIGLQAGRLQLVLPQFDDALWCSRQIVHAVQEDPGRIGRKRPRTASHAIQCPVPCLELADTPQRTKQHHATPGESGHAIFSLPPSCLD